MRIKRVLAVAGIGIAVVASIPVGFYFWQINSAESMVESIAKDPTSVLFRKTMFNPVTNTVCGEFNAKNGFGAYSGFTQFVVNSGKVYVVNDVDVSFLKDPKFNIDSADYTELLNRKTKLDDALARLDVSKKALGLCISGLERAQKQ